MLDSPTCVLVKYRGLCVVSVPVSRSFQKNLCQGRQLSCQKSGFLCASFFLRKNKCREGGWIWTLKLVATLSSGCSPDGPAPARIPQNCLILCKITAATWPTNWQQLCEKQASQRSSGKKPLPELRSPIRAESKLALQPRQIFIIPLSQCCPT